MIPGVAIATAQMPPLCTVGYGIAHLELRFILGAFYLFLINSVFIALATVVTVKYLHFPLAFEADATLRRRSARWSAVIILALLVPSVLSGIEMIRDNNFERNVQRIVQQNKSLGKSYIYDYKIDVEADPPTIEIYVAGEKMEDIARERLYQQAEAAGIVRSQISIHEDAAFQYEMMTESELIRGIIDSHNRQVEELEAKITELSGELQQYKNSQLPSALITREMAAQYEGIQGVTLTRGERVDAVSGEGKAVIVAIIQSTLPIKEADRLRIRNWLTARLGVEDVDVIVNTSKR